ncbi:hypothetical protein AB0G05_19910 [Nonomuraea wenchangensis]
MPYPGEWRRGVGDTTTIRTGRIQPARALPETCPPNLAEHAAAWGYT